MEGNDAGDYRDAVFHFLHGLLVVIACAACTAAEKGERVFRAGAAASNITPPLGELIVGGWEPIPATHIHDELHARCLVLDDGSTKLAIVLCDNVGIPQEVFDLAQAANPPGRRACRGPIC